MSGADSSRARSEAKFAARYGPCALVLGGAQGIGLAFACELARRGLDVLVADVRDELLPAAAWAARAANAAARVDTLRIDLAAPDVADQLQAIDRDLGLVVYTAMIPIVGAFLDAPLARHEAADAVGCRGVLAASHVFGERLVARGRGGLILTSSGAGFQGTGWVAHYSACKAFDLALAEALWWEWQPHGVDVLALCPGSTATPGMLGNQPRMPASALAQPDDVAREALDALGKQSVCIPGEDNRKTHAALMKLPREQLVRVMGENTRKLFTGS